MLKLFLYILIVFLVIFLAILIWQMTAYKVSEPFYKTLKTDGAITIRQYPVITVAQVEVTGDRYHSISSGFRLLANYIFGGNQAKQKIAMTAPVIQTPLKEFDSSSETRNHHEDAWVIRFVMPANFNETSLPQPENARVKITSIAAKKYIVIRFSGLNSESNINTHLFELKHYIETNALDTVGSPVYAFYNPPWILPFLRRNEIMIELKKYP